jgi:hypothetical protein
MNCISLVKNMDTNNRSKTTPTSGDTGVIQWQSGTVWKAFQRIGPNEI